MFLLSTVLFISCEQDDTVNKQEVKVKSRFTTLKINELPTAFRSNSFIKKVKSLRENRLNKNANSSTGFQIDTDHIGMFDNGNEKTFTFKVTTDSISSSRFNLLVRTDANYNVLNSDLLEYVPDPSWLANTQQPFSGQLFVNRITSLSSEVTDLLSSLSLQKSNGQCVTGVTTGWICKAGLAHDPSEEAAGNCNGGAVFYFDFQYGPCQGSPLDNEVPAFDIDAGNPHNGGGTNTNTSGGSNAPGRPCDPLVVPDCGNASMPILIDLPVLVDQATQDFFNSLDDPLDDDDLGDYINSPEQNELRKEVDEFLIEENHDQPAKDFAEEAIKAKEESENNEVDFENKSIYKKELPECLKTIIDKFKPTNKGISIDMNGVDQAILNQLNVPGDIMQLFDNNENYGLKFEMEVINDRPDGSRTNAKTHTEINPNGSKMAVITFNTNYVNTATDLALARTAIHELLHAYINYATRNRDPNTTIAQMIDLVLGQTFALPSSLQHEVMARQLIGAMAGSLAQWDNYQQAPIEYTRLAWSGGMRDSDVFENLDPNEKLAIIAVDQVESGEPQNSLPMLPMGQKSC